MKIIKLILWITIISLLSAAVLAGCGNTENNGSSESVAESVQSSVSNSTKDESTSEANQNRNLTDQTEPKKPDPIEKMHGEWLDVLYKIGCRDSADYNASEEKRFCMIYLIVILIPLTADMSRRKKNLTVLLSMPFKSV